MDVVQSSFSKSERGVHEEYIALAKSYLTGCFQFDSLNRSSDLKFVSGLRFCLCLRLIQRLSREGETYFRTWIALTFENTDFIVRRVDGSIAASLSARNGVAALLLSS
jgi:hypothetical protein